MYFKYAQKKLTTSDVQKVIDLYGEDIDEMINDIYQKYRGKPLSLSQINKIKSLYFDWGMNTESEDEQDSSFFKESNVVIKTNSKKFN